MTITRLRLGLSITAVALFCVLAASIVAFAQQGANPAPLPVATPTPALPPAQNTDPNQALVALEPLSARQVAEAVRDANTAALVPKLDQRTRPCVVAAPGKSADVPCPAGTLAGTQVRAVNVGDEQPLYLSHEWVSARLAEIATANKRQMVFAATTDRGVGIGFTVAPAVKLTDVSFPVTAVWLEVEGGQITRIVFLPDYWTPTNLYERDHQSPSHRVIFLDPNQAAPAATPTPDRPPFDRPPAR